ncbi:hypothetical protein [Hymenobacter sublimis]|uniref:Uncharacterized protein n=1 Tax=Hymenobacter sublimis TaxID=2933777 RepID=A0ABY4JE08_9BACT|nr:hypothetical protein [Hymenobacter sublimis]UPL51069.1 hypothetical protein MWH26_09205 [Hymenobacter sublimis]
MTQHSALPEDGTTHLPIAPKVALRDLYRVARRLHFTDPYAPARLTRIADQAEYFLHAWPAEEWPQALHSGQALPSRSVLLAWVAAAKREAALAAVPWSYASWQRVATMVLAALAPFT